MEPEKTSVLKKALLVTAPFWQAKLDLLSHPCAIRMADDLDANEPLGIGHADTPFWKGFKHTYGEKDSNIDFLLRIKSQHPKKIVIVQIGEFYETWGIDSVFLVEHCGLNRMGRRGVRAGTPIVNIQKVLDDLTQVGFSVVVCEQAHNVIKSGRKTRFIAEIVTPSSPVYTHGLAMDKMRCNTLFPEAPPEFALVFDKRGVTVIEINTDLRTVLTLEGLTKEAALVRLSRYGGRLNHVYCHENVDKPFIDACQLQHENVIKVTGYLPRVFPRRVEELIKIDLSLAAGTQFTHVHPVHNHGEITPRPLYLSTAQQMGILPVRGVPRLIEYLLPKGSPVTCQTLITNFLLNPPPLSVAADLRKTVQAIGCIETAFPEFPVANPARYVKTLQKHEASPDILKDLYNIAGSFLVCYQAQDAWALASALNVVSTILNFAVKSNVLATVSHDIIATLADVLPHGDDDAYLPRHPLISKHLFEYVENEFRGHVVKTATPDIYKCYKAVKMAAFRYEKALQDDLIPLIEQRAEQRSHHKKLKPLALSFDLHNKAIWMRGPVNRQNEGGDSLYHPIDRYGKTVKDRWTTVRVEKYLREYKEAAEQARLGIAALLSDISKKLSTHNLAIVHVATYSNVMRALTLHTKECTLKGWSLKVDHPHLHHRVDQPVACDANQPARLQLTGFFPYWMSPHVGVKNSLTLNGMALLTGHNMAGKSTAIRSAAVVSLLAAAGFMFPAKSVGFGDVLDGWYLRTGICDDPAAGLSTFAVEMNDIKIALRDASGRTFVLIDELGKGTESRAGHAIAGSVLEHLQARNIKGIFATHWHELFFNPAVQLDNLQMISMDTNRGNATYKITAGSCLSSSAFQTALELGVDKKIIERAKVIEGASFNYKSMAKKKEAVEVAPPRCNGLSSTATVAEAPARYVVHSLVLAGEVLRDITNQPLEDIKYLAANQQAAVADSRYSVIYILRIALGFYYVGETDNIGARIESHRKIELKKDCEFVYARIPDGKSAARKIETQIIHQLKSLGFPLLSVEDGRHRHFGSA